MDLVACFGPQAIRPFLASPAEEMRQASRPGLPATMWLEPTSGQVAALFENFGRALDQLGVAMAFGRAAIKRREFRGPLIPIQGATSARPFP